MSSLHTPSISLKTLLIQLNERLIALGKPVQLLRHLHPTNATQERERFFVALQNSQEYNPHFEYKPPSFDIKEIREQLSLLNLDFLYSRYGLPIKPLLSFANELYSTLRLIEARSTPSFTHWATEFYGVPNEQLIKNARQLLEQKPSYNSEEANISAEEVKRRFEQNLHNNYGLAHWVISLEASASARITVSPGEQVIKILSDARFTQTDVDRLVAHEIDAHVLRAENGALQPYYKVLATGLQNYIETEEGLATLNESVTETLDLETLRAYALRVLAVAWSQHFSFYETYLMIVQHEESSRAYDLTLRVKRGLGDTSQAGGFTKDYLYFSGYEKLQEYYRKRLDISLLYVGKIGLQDLDYLSQLTTDNLIKPAHYLPNYYRK